MHTFVRGTIHRTPFARPDFFVATATTWNRLELLSRTAFDSPADEVLTALRGYTSYFGPFSVDEDEQVATHDTLILSPPGRMAGGAQLPDLGAAQ